jgi:hypothetical protein
MQNSKFNIIRSGLRTVSMQSKLCPNETGGMLVGVLTPLEIIMAAGCPGPNAVHTATQFTSDPQADQACLNEARRLFGDCVMPLGWWHKHPAGMDYPSGGDVQQMKQLAEEYADGKPVLAGIVNRVRRSTGYKTTLHLYGLNADNQLVEHPWKSIGSHDTQLLAALKSAPARPQLQAGDYWTNEDFRSYLNPIGRDRIQTEIAILRASGWDVIIGRCSYDRMLVLKLNKDSLALQLVLPPEFPLNAPDVFINGQPGNHILETLKTWSSLHSLLEIVEEVAGFLNCSCCQKRFRKDFYNH